MDTDEELVEVFSASNMFVAQAAIDEVLAPAGIDGVIRDRSAAMLPAPAAMSGAVFIAVPQSQIDKAIDALEEALEDGAIEGEIIDHEEEVA